MIYLSRASLAFALLLCLCAMPAQCQPEKSPASQRTFMFHYGGVVTGLKSGQLARIWLPIPPSNSSQQIKIASKTLPGKVQRTREKIYGNEMFFLEAQADDTGAIPFEVVYEVNRREARGELADQKFTKELRSLFLGPDKLVPIDGKPLSLLAGKKLPPNQLELAKLLFDVVSEHMTYSKKGTGWGRGDAVWACDSRYGNCTDFHSLFISLARSQKVPAKFEIGFALPTARGRGEVPGYHCWAWFRPEGHGWIPVDISQANQVKDQDPQLARFLFGNLTADRVAFTQGRDLVLAPAQAGPPLNFFIYPYVEVEGRSLPADQIRNRFRYEDPK